MGLSEIPANHPTSALVIKDLVPDEFFVKDEAGNAVTNLSELKDGGKTAFKSNSSSVGNITVTTIKDTTGAYQATALKLEEQRQEDIFVPLVFADAGEIGGYYSVTTVYDSGLSGLKANYKGIGELELNNLPRISTAQYKGLAIGFTSGRVTVHRNYGFDIGSITLDVVFSGNSNSRITKGKITRKDKTEITLERAPITGSSGKAKYSGNAKATVGGQSKTGSYEGKFLGKDAAYTVGKVEFTGDVQFLNAAFGAGRTK